MKWVRVCRSGRRDSAWALAGMAATTALVSIAGAEILVNIPEYESSGH